MHQRAVAAAAPGAGLPRPLLGASGWRPAVPSVRPPPGGMPRASQRPVPCGSRVIPDLCCQTVSEEHAKQPAAPGSSTCSRAGPRRPSARRADRPAAGGGDRIAGDRLIVARGGRHRQDAGDRGPLSVAGRRRAAPRSGSGCWCPTAARAAAASASAWRPALELGYEELYVLTPPSWRA